MVVLGDPSSGQSRPTREQRLREDAWAALEGGYQLLASAGCAVTAVRVDQPGEPVTLSPRWLRSRLREVEWPANALMVDGTRYEDLRVGPPAAPAEASTPEPAPKPARKGSERSFKADDEALAKKIIARHEQEKGKRSLWQLALDMAHLAKGNGTLESKAKRLRPRVEEVLQPGFPV